MGNYTGRVKKVDWVKRFLFCPTPLSCLLMLKHFNFLNYVYPIDSIPFYLQDPRKVHLPASRLISRANPNPTSMLHRGRRERVRGVANFLASGLCRHTSQIAARLLSENRVFASAAYGPRRIPHWKKCRTARRRVKSPSHRICASWERRAADHTHMRSSVTGFMMMVHVSQSSLGLTQGSLGRPLRRWNRWLGYLRSSPSSIFCFSYLVPPCIKKWVMIGGWGKRWKIRGAKSVELATNGPV